MVTSDSSIQDQSKFQAVKSEVNSEMRESARNQIRSVNWKALLSLDPVQQPDVNYPEPYCIKSKGAVIGRCNELEHNCDQDNFQKCLCHGDKGVIEKCSKFFCYIEVYMK